MLRADRVDEIAYHLTEGGLTGDAGRALDAALTAGRHPLDRLLPERAALHFDRALLTITTTPLGDPGRRWAALMGGADGGRGPRHEHDDRVVLAAIDLTDRMAWRERVVEPSSGHEVGRGTGGG